MKRIKVHVGYPKAMSTTLQRSVFSKSKNIHYLGIGCDDEIGYLNEDIEYIFEILLKYSREDFFDQKKEHYKNVLDLHTREDILNVVSSEHLTLNFSLQGIDPREKIRRLAYLLHDFDTSIVIITRDKNEIIKSLYSEYVKMGYYHDFEYYKSWIHALADRNFLLDLDFEKKAYEFRRFFSDVTVFNYDDLSKDLSNLLREFDAFEIPSNIMAQNASLDERILAQMRWLNCTERREMGVGIMEPFERHRNRTLLRQAFSEDVIFSEVQKKRAAFKKAGKE